MRVLNSDRKRGASTVSATSALLSGVGHTALIADGAAAILAEQVDAQVTAERAHERGSIATATASGSCSAQPPR